jgi:NADP-dependent 3-hydroxy acid dehydrogenase YdfG
VAVVTGASTGIGRATAIEFARSGACYGSVEIGILRSYIKVVKNT